MPDPRRVIAKPFLDDVAVPSGESRSALLIRRVLAIPEADVARLLEDVLGTFAARHHGFEEILERHFQMIADHVDAAAPMTRERRLLLGAYFTSEYSVEGAALFNPSIVLAPDQENLGPGERRIILSLRAVGEGHISSIEFRSGVLGAGGELCFEPPGTKLVTGSRSSPESYDLDQFRTKLTELGVWNALAESVLSRLSERFTTAELEGSLHHLGRLSASDAMSWETEKIIRVLAASNYVTRFPSGSALAERVLFPAGPHETHGMEDARFVRFVDDDASKSPTGGEVTYYATYTAYDGFEILPQLIETRDFLSFTISTLNGMAAQNKGMALFPRRIGGRYAMLSRKDRENLHLATSDDVRLWNEVTELHEPSHPWELRHIGNCGSPMETSAGWLVITHGVGPMRRYCLGAILLDLDDPSRVIGQLSLPLLEPEETEREGYVPNVLYSCGGMIHGDDLIFPYGFSDHGIAIATISVPELLTALRRG
jgi:predicted GH43/DUF377 family glycosyl hydrolase